MTRLLIIILSLLCLDARAQKTDIATTKLNKKLSILNGKAFLSFPDSAKSLARASDIMGTDPNENRETRVMYDIGDMRLVFFAQEMFRTADSGLFEKVSKHNDPQYQYKRKVLTNKDSLLSVLSSPTKFDSTKKAILVNSLLVKTQDNSVFSIEAYINPEAYKNKAAYQQLSERVFSSLEKGTRRFNLKARREAYEIKGTKQSFSAFLPENYVATVDAKYDFQVLKFEKYKSISDTNWQSLTIYTGYHPSYFFNDQGFKKEDAKKEVSTFLDEALGWIAFHDTVKNVYLKEQIVKADYLDDKMVIHIAMMANNAAAMAEMTDMVERVALLKNKE